MTCEEEDVHPIFNKDPEEWMQYVYKKVSVVTEDGLEHTGLVYTVDPVSESFVLVNAINDQTKVEIVLGHAVTSVTVLSDATEVNKQQLDSMFRPESELKLSREELKRKQNLVKSWLLKNRLPVEVGGSEDEVITVAGALIIQPPYEPENCISTNEIILGKIQGLIKNMPKDHENW